MLFIVDAAVISNTATVDGKLIYKLNDEGIRKVGVPFKNIKHDTLISSSDIASNGMFNISKNKTHRQGKSQ